jgi:hypothetical protein
LDIQNNFGAVVAAYTNFIAQDVSFCTSQGNSQVAAVAGTEDNGSGGSHHHTKRPHGQIAQVTVSDRYYTREENVETNQTRTQDFALCCSNGNYLFAFEVYTGKDNTADGSAYETVMRMLRLRNVIERKR